MSLMPTGNDSVWMIRIRDRGQVFKVDLLDLCKKAGMTKDAWGNDLPENRGEAIKKRLTAHKKKLAKEAKEAEKEDETKSS